MRLGKLALSLGLIKISILLWCIHILGRMKCSSGILLLGLDGSRTKLVTFETCILRSPFGSYPNSIMSRYCKCQQFSIAPQMEVEVYKLTGFIRCRFYTGGHKLWIYVCGDPIISRRYNLAPLLPALWFSQSLITISMMIPEP